MVHPVIANAESSFTLYHLTRCAQWTLAQLRQQLHREGKADAEMWARVAEVVTLTMLTLTEVSGVCV